MGIGDEIERANVDPSPGTMRALAELLDRSGIDLADVSRVERVNVWQGFMKNDEGEAETVDLHGISLVPRWADGPKWELPNRGPTIRLPAPKYRKADVASDWPTCVVLPDMQIGYFRTNDHLEPTHDERAIRIALRIIHDLQPDQVVMVGDNLDLPEFGKYRHSPAFARTTQATVDRGTHLCAELRQAAGPDCEITWLAGNHEERLPNWIMDNAKAAFGLRRGATVPEKWPVLSVPFLCRMDDFQITYMPGYPASSHWVTPRLRVIHGDIVRASGTAHAYLQRESTSVIYGHIHRREYAARTSEDHDGRREDIAASPGCLARTDGAVPSTKGGTDLDGRPLTRQENWQQGLAVIPYDPKTGRFAYEPVGIDDGSAFWRGRMYRPEDIDGTPTA